GFEKWAFTSSITYSDFDNLRMGSRGPEEYLRKEDAITRNGEDLVVPNENPLIETPTGYEQINLLQKIAYQPNDTWDLSFGAYYSTTSDFPRYDRLYQIRNGQLRSAEWYYGPQSWFLGNFQLEKKGNGNLYDKAKLTTAYQYFEESRNDRNFGGEIKYNSKEAVDVWSANLDLEKSFGRNKLFYGAEYILNFVGSEGSGRNIISNESGPAPSRYPDGSSWHSIAAYSGFQWEVSPAVNMQFGARYNAILLNANFEESYYDLPFTDADINTGAVTGSAGINWRPNEYLTLKANVSTAFRAPNIDDVGKIFDSEHGSIVVPNHNLKPEYAYNGDIGFIWKVGDFLILDASSFYTILENALVRRDYE